ncbi:AraC family transcriptional regulator ligand-binding domain-containing protein [Algiphilus sp.]|uniref:AraC family transcriptional regulator n=1 Tax=Algiphilus sp. TaxID=1872431 RepID=UPI003B529F72
MTDEVYVWGGLGRLLCDYLDEQALDAPELRAELQAYEASQRLPITAWWALLEELARVQPRPALGLCIGRQVKVHHLGVLGYLGASCETLGEALLRFQRFQPLLHNLTPNLVDQRGETLRLSWDPSYGQSTLLSNEVLVSGLLSLLRNLTGRATLIPALVEFPEAAPGMTDVYEELLGCPVRFEARTLFIHLPLATMAWPINSRDPHLQAVLEQQAEALLQVLPQPDAFLSELQQVMLRSLQEGQPSIKQVADTMGVPQRTLYRRLESRGVTYKVLLSQMRFQLARRYLADRRLSLPEIALMLGYSEQSAFNRAFKSWSGQTPLHYRRRLLVA